MSQYLSGKSIFFGNIKGGVGKSTLCMFLYEMVRLKLINHSTMLVDTDPQMTTSTMMRQTLPENQIKQMPTGDRYDGVSLSSLDGLI